MKSNNLLTQVNQGILTITINRESKLNALNFETITQLDEVFTKVYNDSEIKAVIITGAGKKAFVAGADITEFVNLDETNARNFAKKGQAIFQKIAFSPKVVVAAVNGFALGGGCELAMACHIRIASENALFGQPEVNLGIIPGYGGTQRLPKLVGTGKALELTLTGELINAIESKKIGLVNYVTPLDKLKEKCYEIINKIITKAPIAISQAIKCVVDSGGNNFEKEANAFAACCKTEDFKEGASAFIEKRKPNFKGK